MHRASIQCLCLYHIICTAPIQGAAGASTVPLRSARTAFAFVLAERQHEREAKGLFSPIRSMHLLAIVSFRLPESKSTNNAEPYADGHHIHCDLSKT
jgi:hypothetical protein